MALFFPAVAQVSPNRPAIPLLRESGFKNIASEPLRTSFDFTLLRRTDRKTRKLEVSVAASSVLDEKDGGIEAKKEKLRVVVKPVERPRLMLKFVWMEKNIGIALDQVIPGGQGTIPLSPYYFWPRKDAWEELKTMLDSKPWIPQRQKVILLNQATDIINFWQK